MIPYLVGGLLLWHMMPKPKEEPTAQAPQADPFAAQCPVDPSLPPQGVEAVRNCWQRGTVEDLESFAGALGLQFPIARMSLLARAHDITRAASILAARAKAPPPAAPAPGAAPRGEVPAPAPTAIAAEKTAPKVRPMTAQEIALAENKAAIEHAAANGKTTASVMIPTTVIDTTGEEQPAS